MSNYIFHSSQRGATLVVGLIMLVVITLMVTTAFTLSKYNLKSVGNMQSRNEGIAAANKAIEEIVGSWDLTTPPTARQINVDIDNNGTADYVVNIAAPSCVSATASTAPGDAGSDCTVNPDGTISCANSVSTSVYTVVWDIDANVTGIGSSTNVRVRQGVSKSLSQAQCNAACPLAGGASCV